MLIRADHDSIWNFSVRVLAGAVRHNILIFSVRVIDSQHRPDWRTRLSDVGPPQLSHDYVHSSPTHLRPSSQAARPPDR